MEPFLRLYLTVTFTVVDIFGYDPDRATVSRRTHDVVRRGATSRPAEIEHGPDSLHLLFPFEGVVTIDVNNVRVPFFTLDFFTLNPGRADTVRSDGDARPVGDVVEIKKVYEVPFVSPATVHEVDVVMQPADGGTDVTTYDAPDTEDADHVSVMEVLPDAAVADAGASGAKPATTVVVTAALVPPSFDAVTEMLYAVPFVRPMMVHEFPPTTEHVAFPGEAVAVYVTPATLPPQFTTAPELVGNADTDVTGAGGAGNTGEADGTAGGTYNKRFAV